MTTKAKTPKINKVFNSLTQHLRKPNTKKKFSPSLTVPDQTMSLRELIDRQKRGLPIGGEGTPVYLDDDGIGIDMSKMTKIEKTEVLHQAADELKELHDKLTSQKLATEKAKEAQRIIDIERLAVQKHIENEEKDSTNTP